MNRDFPRHITHVDAARAVSDIHIAIHIHDAERTRAIVDIHIAGDIGNVQIS